MCGSPNTPRPLLGLGKEAPMSGRKSRNSLPGSKGSSQPFIGENKETHVCCMFFRMHRHCSVPAHYPSLGEAPCPTVGTQQVCHTGALLGLLQTFYPQQPKDLCYCFICLTGEENQTQSVENLLHVTGSVGPGLILPRTPGFRMVLKNCEWLRSATSGQSLVMLGE